jgi:beta-glucosidase
MIETRVATESVSQIAVIGPNSKTLRFCGGGSAALRPYNNKSIYDAMLEVNKNTKYALGCEAHAQLPSLSPLLRIPGGKSGFFTFNVYLEPPGDPHRTLIDSLELDDTNVLLIDYQHPKVKDDMFFADMTAELCPDKSGDYLFGLTVAGTALLYIDDKLLIDNSTVQRPGDSFFGSGTVEEQGRVTLEAGEIYRWRVEFGSAPTSKTKQTGVTMFGPGGVRVGYTRIIDAEEEIRQAIDVASEVDQVILCCGLSGDWESEGFDRSDMHLPGLQNRLIEEVCKANSRTDVVLQSGTPVTTPWVDQVPAILQAWYGGNETASAIVDTLFGRSCPSGKLPLSWPKRNEHNPAFLNYRSDEGRCRYGEDVFVGYRYYEKVGCEVQWPFGFGLSYAQFKLSRLQITREHSDELNEMLLVTVQVKNVSSNSDGAEVVQLYIDPPTSGIKRPIKELKAFTKVFVPCGRTVTAIMSVSLRYATSYWSEREVAWVSQKATYKVLIGTSSDNTPLEAEFDTNSTLLWTGL